MTVDHRSPRHREPRGREASGAYHRPSRWLRRLATLFWRSATTDRGWRRRRSPGSSTPSSPRSSRGADSGSRRCWGSCAGTAEASTSRAGLGAGTALPAPLCAGASALRRKVEGAQERGHRIPDGGCACSLIDDEEVVREMVAEVLEPMRAWTCSSPETGSAASSCSTSGHGDGIDVVLLDLSMPGMSGEETFARLVQERPPDIPVVLSSGYDHAEAMRRFEGRAPAGFHPEALPPRAAAGRDHRCVPGGARTLSFPFPPWQLTAAPLRGRLECLAEA